MEKDFLDVAKRVIEQAQENANMGKITQEQLYDIVYLATVAKDLYQSKIKAN